MRDSISLFAKFNQYSTNGTYIHFDGGSHLRNPSHPPQSSSNSVLGAFYGAFQEPCGLLQHCWSADLFGALFALFGPNRRMDLMITHGNQPVTGIRQYSSESKTLRKLVHQISLFVCISMSLMTSTCFLPAASGTKAERKLRNSALALCCSAPRLAFHILSSTCKDETFTCK